MSEKTEKILIDVKVLDNLISAKKNADNVKKVVYKVKDINFESNSQPKGASGIYTKSFSHFTDSY